MAASVVETAAVSRNGIKTLLTNDVSTLFINGKQTLVNRARKLSNYPLQILLAKILCKFVSFGVGCINQSVSIRSIIAHSI